MLHAIDFHFSIKTDDSHIESVKQTTILALFATLLSDALAYRTDDLLCFGQCRSDLGLSFCLCCHHKED